MNELDTIIEKEEGERDRLKELLREKERTLNILYKARAELKGDDYSIVTASEKSIPDHLENLLREHGPQHVKVLKKMLLTEKGVDTGKQTVSGALIRYSNQGRRFKRVGPNVFDILEDDE